MKSLLDEELPQPQRLKKIDHSSWNTLLKKYVDVDGMASMALQRG
jgi:hypothetical protein